MAMEMDLYVQLKAFDLVRDYTEFKSLDPDEALAMLQAQERLIEKVKKQKAKEEGKDLRNNPNFQAIERMSAEYSQRLR